MAILATDLSGSEARLDQQADEVTRRPICFLRKLEALRENSCGELLSLEPVSKVRRHAATHRHRIIARSEKFFSHPPHDLPPGLGRHGLQTH